MAGPPTSGGEQGSLDLAVDAPAPPTLRSRPAARRGPPGRPGEGPGGAGGDDALAILSLRAGETVRWRSVAGTRWHAGTVHRRERDGSIGVVDARGAARSLPVERVWVGCVGPRGGPMWEPLTERAGRCEQLCLPDLWSGLEP